MTDKKAIISACLNDHYNALRLHLHLGVFELPKNLPENNLRTIVTTELKTTVDFLVYDEFSELGDKLNQEEDTHPDAVTISYYLQEIQKLPKYKDSCAIIKECLASINQFKQRVDELMSNKKPSQPISQEPIAIDTNSYQQTQKIFVSKPPKQEKEPLVQPKEEKVECCTLF